MKIIVTLILKSELAHKGVFRVKIKCLEKFNTHIMSENIILMK